MSSIFSSDNLHNSWILVMKLVTVSCILVYMASSICAQTCDSPDCYINEGIETTCSYCPVGQGVAVENRELQYCSSSPPRDTRCEPCVAGVNFSDATSRSKCMECRRCHADKENQTKACTPSSDGECACKEGLFYHDHDTESCVHCTMCREDQEEKKPCTPTENRECGNKSTTTTLLPSTVHPVTNQTTTSIVSPITAGTGMSTEEVNTGSKSLWWIGPVVLAILIIIIVIVYKYRKNQNAANTRQNGDACDGFFVVNLNCCIAKQTNRYNAGSTSVERNGDVRNYHQVPSLTGSERNGMSNGQSHATTSITSISQEMELHVQQSPANILGFSQETFERLVSDLDERDYMGRNAHMLADQNLEMSQETESRLANSERQALEVLRMWVQQEKRADHLIQALKSMGRDDIANYCEEDLNGS